MPFLIGFSIAILLLFLVLFIRTLVFKPEKKETVREERLPVDTERAVGELSALIECRTVSSKNKKLEDDAEFIRFEHTLPGIFPVLFENVEFERSESEELFCAGAASHLRVPPSLWRTMTS